VLDRPDEARQRTQAGQRHVLATHAVERLLGDIDALYRELLAITGIAAGCRTQGGRGHEPAGKRVFRRGVATMNAMGERPLRSARNNRGGAVPHRHRRGPLALRLVRRRRTLVLCAMLLLAVSLGLSCSRLAAEGLPKLVLPALALPVLALGQMVLGRSAAPVWTAEAVVVSSAMLAALVFWSERARERSAAVRLSATILAVCLAQAALGPCSGTRLPAHLRNHDAVR